MRLLWESVLKSWKEIETAGEEITASECVGVYSRQRKRSGAVQVREVSVDGLEAGKQVGESMKRHGDGVVVSGASARGSLDGEHTGVADARKQGYSTDWLDAQLTCRGEGKTEHGRVKKTRRALTNNLMLRG